MKRGTAVFREMGPRGVGSLTSSINGVGDPTVEERTTACVPAVERLGSDVDSIAGDDRGSAANSMRQHSSLFVTEGRWVAVLQHSIPQLPDAAQIGTVTSVIKKAARTKRDFVFRQVRIALNRLPVSAN